MKRLGGLLGEGAQLTNAYPGQLWSQQQLQQGIFASANNTATINYVVNAYPVEYDHARDVIQVLREQDWLDKRINEMRVKL